MKLIEVWMHLLPRWIIDNVLEQLVLSRITLHVHEWDPMTDTIPIHAWIHPWLPLLSEYKLETIFLYLFFKDKIIKIKN